MKDICIEEKETLMFVIVLDPVQRSEDDHVVGKFESKPVSCSLV